MSEDTSKETMESVPCNLCGSWDHKLLYQTKDFMMRGKELFNVVKCRRCDLVFINPRPTQQIIGRYYPQDMYWLGETERVDDRNGCDLLEDPKIGKVIKKNYGPMYKIIKRLMPRPGRMLDVGCGIGWFVSYLKQIGWDVYGVDISDEALEYSKRVFGIKTKLGDIVNVEYPEKHFDLITMIGVLEHLPDPKAALRNIHKYLKDDGRLIIVTQNIEGLGAKIFGKYWNGIDAPRHLYDFSPRTLEAMLQATGFASTRTGFFYEIPSTYTFADSIVYATREFRRRMRGKSDEAEPFQYVIRENGSSQRQEISQPKLFSMKVALHKALLKLSLPVTYLAGLIKYGEIICAEAAKN